MDLSGYNVILTPLGIISAVATAWYSVLELKKQLSKIHKSNSNEILKKAEEQTNLVKIQLEAKINGLELEVQNLKTNVEKDLSNLKENHTVELKNLSEKIELLRDEIKSQSQGILTLLTKLVEK